LTGYRILIAAHGGFPPFLFSVYAEVKHGGIAELILKEIGRGDYEIEYH
jgi:hypothetical protein